MVVVIVEGGGVARCWGKKENSGFFSLHINIPLTPAGSITARRRGYAFGGWSLK